MRRPIAILLLTGTAGMAGEPPSFDCNAASGAVEEAICADPDLARLDQAVAVRFADAVAAARGLDAGAAAAEAGLRAFQRGWIGGRDACWTSEDLRGCVADAYLDREGQLVATWMLEPPSATATWACGGTPALEVTTLFFDTERPSVRIERGDAVQAGSLRPTASGARYDAGFGQFIWVRGDEAIYRDPDPDGVEMACVRSD